MVRLKHGNSFAVQAINLERWFTLRFWSFPVPFTKHALIYFVQGKNRGEPVSFDEVAGPARPYIPVEDITLKRSKDEAIRLGKAYLAVSEKGPSFDNIPLWRRRAFRRGWQAAIEAVTGEANWQEIREQPHANS